MTDEVLSVSTRQDSGEKRASEQKTDAKAHKATVAWVATRLKASSDFAVEASGLPWRRVRTPYRVFLAEFLLVRTRADVVANLFENIVGRFPNMESLATADEKDLIAALEPFGLRKRVPYLKKAAEYLVTQYNGSIPNAVEKLMKVPGLGRYTSVAIVAFAYGAPDVPADVNILRFLSRLTSLPMDHPTKGSAELWALLPFLASDESASPELILDFSRLICRPRRPRCDTCPLQTDCAFFAVARRTEVES